MSIRTLPYRLACGLLVVTLLVSAATPLVRHLCGRQGETVRIASTACCCGDKASAHNTHAASAPAAHTHAHHATAPSAPAHVPAVPSDHGASSDAPCCSTAPVAVLPLVTPADAAPTVPTALVAVLPVVLRVDDARGREATPPRPDPRAGPPPDVPRTILYGTFLI